MRTEDRFDQVAKAMGTGRLSRRQALGRLGIGVGLGVLALVTGRSAVLAENATPCSPSPCSPNATCTQTGTSTYSCTCKSGYSGDGKTCNPINRCTSGTNPCPSGKTCVYTGPGTFVCQ